MIQIICDKCKKVSVLKNEEKYYGKTVSFKCINPHCGQQITKHIKQPTDFEAQPVATLVIENFDGHEKASLHVRENNYTKSCKYALNNDVNIIGRKSKNSKADIQIMTTDLLVSRYHCSIIKLNGSESNKYTYLLKDENSKNGVLLNGKKLRENEELFLHHKDEIGIGNLLIEFLFNYE